MSPRSTGAGRGRAEVHRDPGRPGAQPQEIDIDIPRDKLVVLTGLSGSGKSSLAFDTIFAEGQRRYVESLSAYARQFLGQMEKPDVDHIDGLSPAISIDQKGSSRNPRSTVGTVTEIYDYMRLLFARIGHPHCPICGGRSWRSRCSRWRGNCWSCRRDTRLMILAPVIRDRKGEHPGRSRSRRQGVRACGSTATFSTSTRRPGSIWRSTATTSRWSSTGW